MKHRDKEAPSGWYAICKTLFHRMMNMYSVIVVNFEKVTEFLGILTGKEHK
jgi:hypothetical protein